MSPKKSVNSWLSSFSNQLKHNTEQNALFRVISFLITLSFLSLNQTVFGLNECGTVLAGGTVTCNNDNFPPTDANPYATGIRYNVSGITLNLDTITVTRATGNAIIMDGNSVQPLTLNALGTVNITTGGGFGLGIRNTLGAATLNYNGGSISTGAGSFRVAVYARTDAADAATINYNNGSITTVSDYSYSVNAWTTGTGDVIINYDAGNINTTGKYAGGPYGRALGDGNSSITYSSGTITASGELGFGMLAQTDGSGNASVNTLAGTINTSGSQAAGIHAYVGGSGRLDINVDSPVQVNTSGDYGWGILGTIAPNTNNKTLTINNHGTLNTTGLAAHGIWGWHGGTGDLIIQNTNAITATGQDSDGIRAEANTTSTYQVHATTGTIQSGSGTGAGIHTLGISGGTVNISTTVTIDGSNSNIALLDEAGGVIITTSGNLTGQVILNLGNDTFNLISGTLNGDIIADGTVATANDGNDQFNWSGGGFAGGFNGQNGSDLALINNTANYDGSQILDGGDDTSIADGWVDELTLQNLTSNVTASKIVNWESITLDNATFTLTDNIWTVGDGSVNTGLQMINNTTLDVTTSGLTLNGNLLNDATLNAQDNAANDTVTINGDYSGNGVIQLDTTLNNGNIDITDVLHITGNNNSTTQIALNNINGTGAPTGTGPTDGILLIQVDGAAGNGTFTLVNPVRAGDYLYQLVLNPINGNGYLQSAYKPLPVIPALNMWTLGLLIFLLFLASVAYRRPQ